jgi:hypothetical protein
MIVAIFDNPITRRGFQGKAKLIQYVKNAGMYEGHLLEVWKVKFMDDFETSWRTILDTSKGEN